MDKSGSGTHFGSIAVGKRFLTLDQLIETMKIQIREDLINTNHKLIGELVIELGFMRATQVNEVLDVLSRNIKSS